MDYEPISVALKFGFLAVLYLFLLWIARSALKDLRRTAPRRPTRPASTPSRPARRLGRRATPGWSPSAAAASQPGERFDLFGGLTIGRSADADVRSRTATPPASTPGLQPRRPLLRRGHELDQRDPAERRRR